jgi:hypothetical protein
MAEATPDIGTSLLSTSEAVDLLLTPEAPVKETAEAVEEPEVEEEAPPERIGPSAGSAAPEQGAWFLRMGPGLGLAQRLPTLIFMAALTLARVGRCYRY